MTSELVYNFPLMSMCFTCALLLVPNNNENCKVTSTRIRVHKRCSVLAIWRGRATEIRGPRCAQTTRISPGFWRETNQGIKYRFKRDNWKRRSPHVVLYQI